MQFLKKIFLSTASVFTLSAGLFFTSCAPKNSCDTLVCKNGGTCAADFCNCPTGYDGPECQNKITDRYIGTYSGLIDPHAGQPHKLDTVDVFVSSNPMTLSVVRRNNSSVIYTGVIENKNNTIVIADIVNGSSTTVVNTTIKAPTSVNVKRTLNLNIKEYVSGKTVDEINFNGDLLY